MPRPDNMPLDIRIKTYKVHNGERNLTKVTIFMKLHGQHTDARTQKPQHALAHQPPLLNALFHPTAHLWDRFWFGTVSKRMRISSATSSISRLSAITPNPSGNCKRRRNVTIWKYLAPTRFGSQITPSRACRKITVVTNTCRLLYGHASRRHEKEELSLQTFWTCGCATPTRVLTRTHMARSWTL